MKRGMEQKAVNPIIHFPAVNLSRMDRERQLNRPCAGCVPEIRGTLPAGWNGLTAFVET
jgi:hypothetical protein